MDREYWLDGFNFFHHWDSTKGLLRPDSGLDIVKALDRSIRILGRQLGQRCRYTVVYLDGGLQRNEERRGSLRIRYCGPGNKADDRMVEDLGFLGPDAKMVTAVSNDRELKANLRAYGATCLGVGEFLAVVEGKRNGGSPGRGKPAGKTGKQAKGGKARGTGGSAAMDEAEVMREKCRSLTPAEINAWLDYFGGDMEA